ncbi:WD40-repeat-containing domain protein [Mycotypha africana]|uniref:WD40-repeat-containing domain protein n=1 Tax=Mycotypha africana TaxID=64632 RepID=UPI002301A82B|nr:WD40-repeat-containing domain protein [Mycotypha africana]KAI8967460.1 WD40-repeat-containing domain protein [Mycotypha africana]
MSLPSQQHSLGGDTPLNSPTSNRFNSNANVNQILQAYFHRKGFTEGELAYIQQQDIVGSEFSTISLDELTKKILNESDDDEQATGANAVEIPDYLRILKRSREDEEQNASDGMNIVDLTTQAYLSLKDWIENSLDIYRHELMSLLYPVFIYSFLNLISKGLYDQGNNFFQQFKSNHIDQHEQDILSLENVRSIDDSSNITVEKYYNKKYNIHISSISYDLLLQFINEHNFINLIHLIKQHLNVHIINGNLSPSTGLFANNQIHDYINGLEDDTIALQKVKQENTLDSITIDEIPAVTYRSTNLQADLETLKDLRKRIAQGNAALPSISLYNFHHTHDMLNCLAISDDTAMVAGGFSESYIKVWSMKGKRLQSRSEKEQNVEGTEYKKLIGHSGPVYGLSFSHNNAYLISCSEDETVRLWSLDTFTNVVCYKSHNYPIWDVDFGPYGFYFATASHDRTARLWSCDRTNPLRIFAGHLSDVNTVKFHPNSKYVVTGSTDKTARLWDVQRGTCVRVFTGHTGAVHTVAISPNGRLMASAGEDQTIILWDLGSGKKLKTMTGHTGFIYSVSFNNDSTVLVSGSADNTVRVWDVNKDTPFEYTPENMDTPTKRSKMVNGKQKESKKDLDKAKSLADSNSRRKKGILESNDHLGMFPTKNTPIYTVQFTARNLCLAAGAANSLSIDILKT